MVNVNFIRVFMKRGGARRLRPPSWNANRDCIPGDLPVSFHRALSAAVDELEAAGEMGVVRLGLVTRDLPLRRSEGVAECTT